jgi:hypothetical protein
MSSRLSTLTSQVSALLATVAPFLLTHCGGDSNPLGGPYGGSASSPPPTPEDASAPASGGDDSGGTDAISSDDGESGAITVPMTWTQIYNAYFATGTIGNCTDTGCHNYPTPKALFSYLEGMLQVGGPNPALTNPNTSCLTWYGGDMPMGGAASAPQVVAELNAWAAAGGQDN